MRNKGPPLIELASLSETFNAHLDIPSDRSAAFSCSISELYQDLLLSPTIIPIIFNAIFMIDSVKNVKRTIASPAKISWNVRYKGIFCQS